MPKKRTTRRRRLPNDFGQISRQERFEWSTRGPRIAGRFTRSRSGDEEIEGYEHATVTVWESWSEWANFYSTVREQFRAERAMRNPHKTPACERLYRVIEAGGDPDDEKTLMAEEQRANDPRLKLGVTG